MNTTDWSHDRPGDNHCGSCGRGLGSATKCRWCGWEKEMSEREEFKSYLGDGVYVRWDGFQAWLETGDKELTHAGFNSIALEPQVWTNLLEWKARVDAVLEERHAAAEKEGGA